MLKVVVPWYASVSTEITWTERTNREKKNMSNLQTVVHPFGHVSDNVVMLERSTTEPICEGFNTALASFQALYLQYQKHHFVVEGAEFYSLHKYFQESYEEVQELVSD